MEDLMEDILPGSSPQRGSRSSDTGKPAENSSTPRPSRRLHTLKSSTPSPSKSHPGPDIPSPFGQNKVVDVDEFLAGAPSLSSSPNSHRPSFSALNGEASLFEELFTSSFLPTHGTKLYNRGRRPIGKSSKRPAFTFPSNLTPAETARRIYNEGCPQFAGSEELEVFDGEGTVDDPIVI
ncbi:hypothetical protein BC829DRAFT_386245, partial [Chytridium lagenaria]